MNLRPCPHCGGTGEDPLQLPADTCPDCEGSGLFERSPYRPKVLCERCGGWGTLGWLRTQDPFEERLERDLYG